MSVTNDGMCPHGTGAVCTSKCDAAKLAADLEKARAALKAADQLDKIICAYFCSGGAVPKEDIADLLKVYREARAQLAAEKDKK